jgi:beta-N-acetylhexosaminidase
MVDILGRSLLPEDKEILRHPWVGGVILFTRNFTSVEQVTQLIKEIKALRQPQLLIGVDHEGGRVQRFREGFSKIPAMRQIGLQYEQNPAVARELAHAVGFLIGAELNSVGADLCFAPVADLNVGLSEVIGDRAFAGDPLVVGRLALDLTKGLQAAGMAATAKHFPGHGGVVADSHVALPIDRREYVDLEPDLKPFRTLISNGVPSVMTAHVVYQAVDSMPASLSKHWIKRILRMELGFQGAVVTDDLSMAGAKAFGGVRERVQLALDAGNDCLLICNQRDSVHEALDSVQGPVPAASALRLARLRARKVAGLETMAQLAAHPTVMAARDKIKAAFDQAPPLRLEA